MMERLAVPLFLLAALLLGGSSTNVVGLWTLELGAIALLAWAYWATSEARVPQRGRPLILLSWLSILLITVQLVPLPSGIWQSLPGRESVLEADKLVGLDAVWRPLSLVPETTLFVLSEALIPLAIICAILRRGASQPITAMVIVAAALGGCLVGLAQRLGLVPHAYAFSSAGPTGQFANTNHLAALALAAIPFVAALVRQARERRVKLPSQLVAATIVAVLLVTIFLTGSMAIIGLSLPALALSALIAFDVVPSRRWIVVGAGILVVVFVAFAASDDLFRQAGSMSATRRLEIWRHALMLSPFMWTGGGFGSFEGLYHLVENPFAVDRFYVNHAHNDFIQIAIEGGIPALLLAIGFVVWSVRMAARLWRTGLEPHSYAKASSLAVAILLLHSLVDFPLRTAALLALIAVSAGLMGTADRTEAPVRHENDLRPTRHRRIA